MSNEFPVPDGFAVRESQIHGRGLFSLRNISRGETLGIAQTIATDVESDHSIWVRDEEHREMVCGFRFINHADDPNVIIYDDLSIVALKNIAPEEELTHNYDGSTAEASSAVAESV